ncbi:hypothetical protein PSN45_001973 [Yamadazyma tenuis]|uniref:S-adenosyl-L-methionine-dependent methyltransferase n=1 Tax=Candida tenuis (strain ATCC 10573 / BCRC 21748 / CBS 615 / JCM 9827 / NBRC 10315 / NRRL Y-1498 / VKM Y-70) TaxID=590646 RepID=G3BD91_CANTC|nr:S-adenosyl-L-methionine-dependent methyltransferase [Yamadazyma tenuis ATCC 10573]EGV60271.1 S-adenosyl-L-methionine-dependent methyltransferase [Yamadazyma tenuis ATCC 10573]WEJ94487.1 hypothetical protein PSN45_001973 [Yamadazyma tenuis]
MLRRTLATNAPNHQFNVFDRVAKLAQRSRFPKINPQESKKVEYLRDEVATKTIERLAFITRDLTNTLDFGSNGGNLLKNLCIPTVIPPDASTEMSQHLTQLNKDKLTIRNRISNYTMFDSSQEILHRDVHESYWDAFAGTTDRVVGDEEKFNHPVLKSDYFDSVISNLSLHWINDLPGTLANINRVLKPDGLFLGTLFGGDTLYELRTALQLAELERKGGLSPRVSPLVELNDVGTLLNRAGFNMLTIDTEEIVVGGFPDIVSVCNDLQLMGEQNAVLSRSGYLDRDLLLAANEIYKALHGEKGPDGTVTLPVTFSVIFMIGWKKSENQPQPLPRGSGQVNLKDIL